ncbi:hypothetical protein [Shouchella miscanthi]|uniref:hypothetical protein n=1 Tax=Shouchella miscanthi TaxID=2598861 RepID=UPI0011A0635C|nr:hypothetical protein [Shouchella miscanthi]
MPYYSKTKRKEPEFRGGINILSSEHFQYIEAGITLDAEAIGEKYLPVGTPVARNLETGKFEVYADDTSGEEPALPSGYDEFALLNVDVNMQGEDAIVGEVLIRGSVYDAKLPDTVTETFKKATHPFLRYTKNIIQ